MELTRQQRRFLEAHAAWPRPHLFEWLVQKPGGLRRPLREPPDQWTHFRVGRRIRTAAGRVGHSVTAIPREELAPIAHLVRGFELTEEGRALLEAARTMEEQHA